MVFRSVEILEDERRFGGWNRHIAEVDDPLHVCLQTKMCVSHLDGSGYPRRLATLRFGVFLSLQGFPTNSRHTE
jgi:hypothetical protein